MKRGLRMLDATAHFEAVHELLPGGAEVLLARKAALARAEQTGLPTRRVVERRLQVVKPYRRAVAGLVDEQVQIRVVLNWEFRI